MQALQHNASFILADSQMLIVEKIQSLTAVRITLFTELVEAAFGR